jgi:hypothetical protein
VSVEEALEAAIIAVVGGDASVCEVLGDPLRVEEMDRRGRRSPISRW